MGEPLVHRTIGETENVLTVLSMWVFCTRGIYSSMWLINSEPIHLFPLQVHKRELIEHGMRALNGSNYHQEGMSCHVMSILK